MVIVHSQVQGLSVDHLCAEVIELYDKFYNGLLSSHDDQFHGLVLNLFRKMMILDRGSPRDGDNVPKINKRRGSHVEYQMEVACGQSSGLLTTSVQRYSQIPIPVTIVKGGGAQSQFLSKIEAACALLDLTKVQRFLVEDYFTDNKSRIGVYSDISPEAMAHRIKIFLSYKHGEAQIKNLHPSTYDPDLHYESPSGLERN
ncbi:hypothetical protein RND81_14G232000 [Saponaria officinalis]|uniref:Uncharacterized protein n=1 Tax=Saponaria officinalis TaxID=3572 RepID=A0AAW1GVI9_SAPOF